jgi:ADP-L-glycero-D-manno-heptose 6-epimerase
MILVTGGAGFIGSNLVAALTGRDDQAIAVCDRLGVDDKWRNIAKHSISEFVQPENLFSWLDTHANEIEAVFHLGASSSTTERDADSVVNNNFSLSLAIWRWCSRHDTRLIYASSAATYGDGSNGFNDDPELSAALRPLNLYGWSKHIFDRNALRLANSRQHPPQWVGLKFFNAYGPNEYHKDGQQSVVVQFFEQIAADGKARAFKSHHPDYEDGGQMRDFIWVGDCVDVMLWAYDHTHLNGIYNCGTGTARSFSDLAHACFAAMRQPEVIDFIDTPTEIRGKYQYFTEANMARLIGAGYDKPFTSLEDGVTRYVTDFLASNDPYR